MPAESDTTRAAIAASERLLIKIRANMDDHRICIERTLVYVATSWERCAAVDQLLARTRSFLGSETTKDT